MATKISDLAIVPETFAEYVEKLILERSALIQSGFVSNVPTFIPSKGTTTNAPSFLGFTGDDEVLSDNGALTVNKVGSLNAISAINFRGKAYGSNDLVAQLAGADPLGNLAGKYADYWVRSLNRVAVNTLMGAAEAADGVYGAGSILNKQDAGVISGNMIIDTKALAGEYMDDFSIFLCHSATLASLRKTDLVNDTVIDSVGTTIATYQGMQVVVDDQLPTAGGVHTSVVAAPGAMLYSEGIDPALAIETDRDILAGDDIVTSRKRFILHPSGSSFIGAPTGVSPTNAELNDLTNWGVEDPTDSKRIPYRVLTHLV